jgi:hypothetical protein
MARAMAVILAAVLATPASGAAPSDPMLRDDAALLSAGGLDAAVVASPMLVVEEDRAEPSHLYPVGSLVALTANARWSGSGPAPPRVRAILSFDARSVEWLSPPGRTANDGAWEAHAPSYAFTLDPSAGNLTLLWALRIPQNATEGDLRLPVTLSVESDPPASNTKDLVLRVVSEGSVPSWTPPFWQDPAFILVVGVAIGLAVGFILFGKGKASALPRQMGGARSAWAS